MSLTCELSGEPIATTKEEVVATPSGHICLKRLLLQKLSENGGMDPFETIRERPLSEDQLILLQTSKAAAAAQVPPPRPQATSLPNLLQHIQTEYDALVLELFDTRKALEETRRELSQALYQNDAAVRVVARLSMERDTARQELETWNASVGAAPTTTTTAAAAADGGGGDATATSASAAGDGAPEAAEKDTAVEPQSKRRKMEPSQGPLKNDLPEEDLAAMNATWQELHPKRKPMLKAAAAKAPSPVVLGNYAKEGTKAWHKSTCRSVICMAKHGDYIVTAAKDKQVVVYSTSEEVVKHTFMFGSVPTCVHVQDSLVVVADAKGHVVAYSITDGSIVGDMTLTGTALVDVKIHPTGQHVCIATADGKVIVALLQGGGMIAVAEFQGETESEYTCGAVHPDGLLYAAGTSKGQVHMWDFKNKVLASTMQEGDGEDAVTAIAFSNNGYHLATGHSSAAVRFWDLRKQKTIATMNEDASLLASITTIAYDESGKYAAFGGKGGLAITTVKEWGTTASIATDKGKPVSGVAWTDAGVTSCSDKERAISFYGTP